MALRVGIVTWLTLVAAFLNTPLLNDVHLLGSTTSSSPQALKLVETQD